VTVLATNEHELRVQPNGDVLLFGLDELTGQNLSHLGGPSYTTIVGDVVERITSAGEVTFAWDSLQHLSIDNIDLISTTLDRPAVDFTHGNSIDVMDDGNYLVSFRDMSQVIKLDSTTGAMLWKLGGKDGQFTFVNDPLNGFSCQHGAREMPNGDIILFDDGDGHMPAQSRAVEYQLDTTAMTATLVWSAEDDPALYCYIFGYADRLANGHTVVAYGTTEHIQEVDENGKVVWDIADPLPDYGIYRAYHLDALPAP
jgi:outer membrane protein assembly factor BamB